MKIYFGGYTKKNSKGIYYADFNEGVLTTPTLAAEVNNPTYLALDKVNSFLYCNNSTSEGSSIICFKINEDATLEKVSVSNSTNPNPCFVELDSELEKIYTTIYGDSIFEARTFDPITGHIYNVDFTFNGEGSGPVVGRQDSSHLHISRVQDNYIFICDLGADKIIVLDKKSYKILHEIPAPEGSGPRHIILTNSKAYVITELSNVILEYNYDKETGGLVLKNQFSTLPTEFKGHSQGAAIRLGMDNKFLYVSNRGHNSITVYALDENGAIINAIQNISTYGNWCRDFNITTDFRFLLAGHEKSDNITIFKIKENGMIEPISNNTISPECTCIGILD